MACKETHSDRGRPTPDASVAVLHASVEYKPACNGAPFVLPQSTFWQIILNFTPSWFSVNMGTGIISILIHTSPHQFPGMNYVSTVFYVGNCVLFVIFTLASIARYTFYPWVLGRMLRHPAQCMFVGTVPMGLATIVNATVLIAVPAFGQWAVELAWTLWWMDVVLSVLSCFGVPFLMFHVHQLDLEHMTAAWLLPIVPTVVVAASGGVVATVLGVEHALISLVVSYALWGVGMGLSFMIMALYFHRLAVHKLPNAEVIVSAFLPLGPLGQGAFGVIQMAQAGKRVFPAVNFLSDSSAGDVVFVMSTLVGLVLWGLGWWWLVHGVLSVAIRMLNGGIKFNMGFWGFIFPLGVFTAATIALSTALASAILSYFAVVLIGALLLLWLTIAYGTFRGAMTRELFEAPCLTHAPALGIQPNV